MVGYGGGGQRGTNTQLLYRYSTSPSVVHLRNNGLSHDSAPTDRLPADYVRIEKHVDHEIHGRGGLDCRPTDGVAVILPSLLRGTLVPLKTPINLRRCAMVVLVVGRGMEDKSGNGKLHVETYPRLITALAVACYRLCLRRWSMTYSPIHFSFGENFGRLV